MEPVESTGTRRPKRQVRIPTTEELDRLTTIAVGNAIWRHKRLGEAIVIGREGKPVIIEAEDIPEEWCIPPDPSWRRKEKSGGHAAG
jgi:hypothetical protein